MGALHAYEQGLTLLLAFGPFVLLGLVIWWRRREDEAASRDAEPGAPQPDAEADPPR
jgi:hypothetical protein